MAKSKGTLAASPALGRHDTVIPRGVVVERRKLK